MFEPGKDDFASDAERYASLARQAEALVSGEQDPVANAANLSALIFQGVPRLNWAGFYFLRGEELIVGPFQGLPACVRIPLGAGVCGTAARDRRTVVVEDVDAFPGHIPCDAASRSEVVVPLIDDDGRLLGVLDVDSPERARFGPDDVAGLEAIARRYVDSLA
jgi:GAF domain-containing protein